MNEPTIDTVPPVVAETPQPPIDPLADIKAKLTEADKENFFKAFLSDKPYISEELLFNGKLHIKFKGLSIQENNTIMLQMQYDRDNDVAKNSDAYLIKVIQYRVAASLLELDNKPFAENITSIEYPSDPKTGTYILKRLEIMKDWPLYKISALTDAFNRFEKRLRALTEESFKENF